MKNEMRCTASKVACASGFVPGHSTGWGPHITWNAGMSSLLAGGSMPSTHKAQSEGRRLVALHRVLPESPYQASTGISHFRTVCQVWGRTLFFSATMFAKRRQSQQCTMASANVSLHAGYSQNDTQRSLLFRTAKAWQHAGPGHEWREACQGTIVSTLQVRLHFKTILTKGLKAG